MKYKAWGGRFKEETTEKVKKFNASIEFDWVLYKYDIAGSIAWAEALEKAGIIKKDELDRIKDGLKKIEKEIEDGSFSFSISLEDIHMNIEKRLFELIGEPALKLHTGRSRNDQIALDIRLYLKDKIKTTLDLLKKLLFSIVKKAKEAFGLYLPGYTHLQRAQPILLSHHLLAYYEMFKRDRERFSEILDRVDVLPLGSGALAGTAFPIDREFLAKRLGFKKISRNSMDAVSDRDFIADFLYSSSTTFVHLSRISEELILWSSSEFSFVELPDSFTTGSSMMPQKKNPDVPELIRGKASKSIGALVSILSLMKSLPLTYNKDLQEDKNILFEICNDLLPSIDVLSDMIPLIKFKKENMERATRSGFLTATDLADYLVLKGMPFRKAHELVGKIVLYGMEKGKDLWEFNLDELRKFSELIDADVFDFISIDGSLRRRNVTGGTSPDRVLEEIKRAESELEKI